MIRYTILASACFLMLTAIQTPPKKIFGKYGKIVEGEYICLELFENNNFSMSISECDKDTYINGEYTFDGAAVYLTSEKQPGIKIGKIQSEKTAGKNIITLISPDALLVSEIRVRINDAEEWQSPNGRAQIYSSEPIEKAEFSLRDLKTLKSFSPKNGQNHQVELVFEDLNTMAMNRQKWNLSKKKLVFTDESGVQITLKKSRKCWFDYEFKDE